jgi:hypothetical protein
LKASAILVPPAALILLFCKLRREEGEIDSGKEETYLITVTDEFNLRASAIDLAPSSPILLSLKL